MFFYFEERRMATMKCKKCGATMKQDYVGFSVIYECEECYNVEEVEDDNEEDM